jgi:hypothetical protein
MKAHLLAMVAFLLSLGAGKFVVSRLVVAVKPDSVAESTPVAAPAHRRPTQPAGSPAPAIGASPVVLEHIAWERKMWTLEPGEFPEVFKFEVATVKTSERLFRLMAIWQERDLDGFIAWAGTQPDSMMLPLAGHAIGMSHSLLTAATRKDPEFAWKLAAQTSANSHSADSNRGIMIGLLFRQDPAAARSFVRKHRDEIEAFGQGNIGWFGLDPQKALPVAMELAPGAVRSSIVAELARYYGERADAVSGAREWFQSLPHEHQKEVSKLADGESFYQISETHRKRLKEVWAAPSDE